jgi:uncharacterized protein
MQIILDGGSVLPDVAYLTSVQLGRPFPVRWIDVPDRDARTTTVREQFEDAEVTRGRKFEGVWGTKAGVYVVNSYRWEDGDLPTDAVPHDGMVWFYDYRAQTIQLVTYFPHQATTEDGSAARYPDITFDGPDNVTVTPWGSLVLAEDDEGASRAQLVPRRTDLRHRPQPAQRLGVLRSRVQCGRQSLVRQHAGPRPHAGHHRPLGEVPGLTKRRLV